MVKFQPLLLADGCAVTQFLIQEILKCKIVGCGFYVSPIFSYLVIMIGNLIPAGTSVVDDALFKQRVIIGQDIFAELGAYYAVLPEEIYLGPADAGYALVLIS